MTPQEAQIIRSVFDRLRATETGPRDAEAEGLVEALLRADPRAGLGLVQALVLTERAREAAAGEAEALKQEIETLRSAGPQPAPASGGLFGGPWGGGARDVAPQPGPWGGRAQAPGPWDAQPQAGPGGGFWSSALRTGAGVAGGLFAFEALKGLFGGSHGAGGGDQTAGLFDQPGTVVNETVNIFQGERSGAPADAFGSGGSAQNAALDDGFLDGGGFGGDDDSWA
jgi:hypothetical protein